jgi:hypothetical protein
MFTIPFVLFTTGSLSLVLGTEIEHPSGPLLCWSHRKLFYKWLCQQALLMKRDGLINHQLKGPLTRPEARHRSPAITIKYVIRITRISFWIKTLLPEIYVDLIYTFPLWRHRMLILVEPIGSDPNMVVWDVLNIFRTWVWFGLLLLYATATLFESYRGGDVMRWGARECATLHFYRHRICHLTHHIDLVGEKLAFDIAVSLHSGGY